MVYLHKRQETTEAIWYLKSIKITSLINTNNAFDLVEMSFKNVDQMYIKTIKINVLLSLEKKHGTFVLIEYSFKIPSTALTDIIAFEQRPYIFKYSIRLLSDTSIFIHYFYRVFHPLWYLGMCLSFFKNKHIYLYCIYFIDMWDISYQLSLWMLYCSSNSLEIYLFIQVECYNLFNIY